MPSSSPRALAINGSPREGGKTATVLEAVLAATGGEGERVWLGVGVEAAVAKTIGADVLVLGTPVYRGTYAAPLKAYLDALPRGMWGEAEDALRGTAVVIVAAGASDHHFLALEGLRSILAGFFAAHVVPPGLYVSHSAFDADGGLDAAHAELAAQQGRAAAELAAAIAASAHLGAIRPQV